MLRLTTGWFGADWYWFKSAVPVANDVNATGIVGMIGASFASWRLPDSRAVRSGLPSLKMMTPDAFAACAFWTLTPKLQPPRWIRATWPAVKPLKSLAVHPLVELGAAVGGRMMPPAGWATAFVVPVLCPGFH